MYSRSANIRKTWLSGSGGEWWALPVSKLFICSGGLSYGNIRKHSIKTNLSNWPLILNSSFNWLNPSSPQMERRLLNILRRKRWSRLQTCRSKGMTGIVRLNLIPVFLSTKELIESRLCFPDNARRGAVGVGLKDQFRRKTGVYYRISSWDLFGINGSNETNCLQIIRVNDKTTVFRLKH